MPSKLGRGIRMEKDMILEISRMEHGNRDLPELETAAQAGYLASRVGAAVCVLLTLIFRLATGGYLLSPWVIYFSMLAANSAGRYKKQGRGTDLVLLGTYLVMCGLCLVGFLLRLAEARG